MAAYISVFDVMNGRVRNDVIIRVADNAHIPADPRNADWQAYQAWLAEGNVPEQPAPQPTACDTFA